MIRTAFILLFLTLWAGSTEGKRTYIDNPHLDNAGICLVELDSAPDYFAIEARCAMPRNKVSGRNLNSWRIIWDYYDSYNYTYAEYAIDYRIYVDGIDTPEATVTLGCVDSGTEHIITQTNLRSGQNFDIGYNSMAVEWRCGQIKVYSGANRLIFAVAAASAMPRSAKCGLLSDDPLIISSLIVESDIPASRTLQSDWSPDRILDYLGTSTDSIEGLWRYLDRTNEPAKARMGGSYTLATIWNRDMEVYDLIYMDGATVNKQSWIPGMRKGYLRPTIFQDHFDMVWYDALCVPIKHDCHANISQQVILELNFPLMDTRIRMSKVPMTNRR